MKNFGPKAWTLPQPVLIIGTYDENGTPNAMNAAWGGQCEAHEIMICMGSHKTTRNLNLNNEFTVAFATKETMEASDFVGIMSGLKDYQKIEKTGWKHTKGENVNAPVFDCFPMTMECRIKQKLGSDDSYILIAEIVNVVVDEKYLAPDGNPDVEKMNLITFDPVHMGYIQLGARVGNAFSDGKKLF